MDADGALFRGDVPRGAFHAAGDDRLQRAQNPERRPRGGAVGGRQACLDDGRAGGDYSAQRHGDRVGHGGHGGHRTGAQSRCDDAALHAVSLAVRADAAAHRGRYGADVRHGGVGRATPYRRPAPRLAAYGAADRRRRGLRRCRGPFPAGIPARDAGDRTEVMAQNLLM